MQQASQENQKYVSRSNFSNKNPKNTRKSILRRNMTSISVIQMTLVMRRFSFVTAMSPRNGTIYMTIRVTASKDNRLPNQKKRMKSQSLWRKQMIHNGGEILQMSLIIKM